MANNFLENTTTTVKALLAINVAMFALTYFMPEMFDVLSLHYFKNPLYRPFQLLSHFFMHGNLAHLAFNMYALVMFGTAVELVIGWKKFLFLYFLSAIGAFALHMLVVHYQLLDLTPEIVELLGSKGADALNEGMNFNDNGYHFSSFSVYREVFHSYRNVD